VLPETRPAPAFLRYLNICLYDGPGALIFDRSKRKVSESIDLLPLGHPDGGYPCPGDFGVFLLRNGNKN
jgi:hypothetical protein